MEIMTFNSVRDSKEFDAIFLGDTMS
jgi:hypothetical protein